MQSIKGKVSSLRRSGLGFKEGLLLSREENDDYEKMESPQRGIPPPLPPKPGHSNSRFSLTLSSYTFVLLVYSWLAIALSLHAHESTHVHTRRVVYMYVCVHVCRSDTIHYSAMQYMQYIGRHVSLRQESLQYVVRHTHGYICMYTSVDMFLLRSLQYAKCIHTHTAHWKIWVSPWYAAHMHT